MAYKGTVKGQMIELDEPIPLADGTRVELTIAPEGGLRKNSPQAWLQLVGTLSEEESETLLANVRERLRCIDWEMWPGHRP
ncbi:hypothetical protein [Candidatus Entotheonella palauensis]|uniref:hypothetical protein n=1 Tax=Candidatus Entotheonella palauensis TaxID=93172 RepID=UPI000B7DEF88|nr:hypothetical protein [Candidatus Entotheonella palauensis]